MSRSFFYKIALLSIFICGIPSCEEDCNCCDLDGPTYYQARIVNFEVERVDKQIAPQDWEAYRTGDTVKAQGDLLIYLRSYAERVAFFKSPSRAEGGLMLPSAYACSPVYLPKTDQKFLRLSITSSQDYDQDHPAGADLMDLFMSSGEPERHTNQRLPLAQHLSENSDYFILQAPRLYLNKSPDLPSRHVFQFSLELSDTTFSFQSPELILR